MKTLSIGIDMDGICVDLLGAWLSTLNREHGLSVTKDDISEFRMEKCPKLAHVGKNVILDVLHRDGYFADLPPILGAVSAVEWFADLGHEISIVTALPSTGPKAEAARRNKLAWLRKHMPFINPESVIFTEAQDKGYHAFNVFIDDRADTLRTYKLMNPSAFVCGIEYPYNRTGNCAGPLSQIKLAKDHNDTMAAWNQIEKWVDELAIYGDVR